MIKIINIPNAQYWPNIAQYVKTSQFRPDQRNVQSSITDRTL